MYSTGDPFHRETNRDETQKYANMRFIVNMEKEKQQMANKLTEVENFRLAEVQRQNQIRQNRD